MLNKYTVFAHVCFESLKPLSPNKNHLIQNAFTPKKILSAHIAKHIKFDGLLNLWFWFKMQFGMIIKSNVIHVITRCFYYICVILPLIFLNYFPTVILYHLVRHYCLPHVWILWLCWTTINRIIATMKSRKINWHIFLR